MINSNTNSRQQDHQGNKSVGENFNGELYVYKTEKKNNQDVLRFLSHPSLRPEEDNTPLVLNLKKPLRTKINVFHQKLVLSALNNSTYYFSKGSLGSLSTSDSWYLLLKENNSIRRFSIEYFLNWANLFKALTGLNPNGLLTNVRYENYEKFNLGIYQIISIDNNVLKELIRVKEELGYYNIKREDNICLSYQLIKAIKEDKKNLSEYLYKRIKSRKLSNESIKSKFVIQNALNFYLLRQSPEKSLEGSMQLNKEFVGITLNRELKQLLSNNYYHIARTLHILGRRDQALEKYKKSSDIDDTFYEYFYQSAIILHDKGKLLEAKDFYEKAIERSVLDEALVNDYGCLLSDLGCGELESWENVAMELGYE